MDMCFMQENTKELSNIIHVLENQTVKSSETSSRPNENRKDEDVDENTISDSGDRHPRVFPTKQRSSSATGKSLHFSIQTLCAAFVVCILMAL